MSEPSVSVVIPTCERPDLVRRAIGCVQAQTVPVELIVIDDGDRSGPSAARNRGIEQASCAWVAFLDDDDLWAPEKLALQLAALERSRDSGWVATGAVLLDHDLRPIRLYPPPVAGDVAERFRLRNHLIAGASSVLARTELVRAVGGFDESLTVLEDWDLWIRLADASPLATIGEPVVGYQRRPGGRSHDVAAIAAAFPRVAAKHGLEIDRSWELLYRGEMHRRAGDRIGAARLFLEHHGAEQDRRSLARAIRALCGPA